jgi:hypothetical protein
MHNISTYTIEIRGPVDERSFNALSPLQATVLRSDPAATLFAVSADQSGLIGLLRHLHGQGFVLLSLAREGSTLSKGE